MNRRSGASFRFVLVAFCLMTLASAGWSQVKHPPANTNPQFDQMKTLDGDWEGTMVEAGQTYPARTSFRLVSDKSVLMNTLGAGSPHEMITMFHMDGNELMATHYCAAHNQPRFRAVSSSDLKTVDFDFKDATNVPAGAGHMNHIRFIFVDPDHHIEEWSTIDNGKTTTGSFDFHRKKS